MLSASQTATEIQRIIDDDPTILESEHITVSAAKRGMLFFKKEEIHLDGSVHHKSDKQKAEEIAIHYAGKRELINGIKIIN